MLKQLLVAAGAAALVSSPALAVDDDLLQLSGTIDYQCDVTMLGQATATVNMYISASQPLGQVRYICNDPQGFKVNTKSLNNGTLKSGSYTRAYTASMGGGEVGGINYTNVSLTSAGVPQNVAGFQADAADAAGTVHDFSINLFIGGGPLPGGVSLSDNITFELTGL